MSAADYECVDVATTYNITTTWLTVVILFCSILFLKVDGFKDNRVAIRRKRVCYGDNFDFKISHVEQLIY